jgi:hypothetical protein
MNGYDAYVMFRAVKLHFTSSYDYVKYNGSVKVKEETYENLKDQYRYRNLVKKYHANLLDFLVANFSNREISWVGDLFAPDADRCFQSYRSYKESFTYKYKEECLKLLKHCEVNDMSINDLFNAKGKYPEIFIMLQENEISIETVIILIDILELSTYFNQKLKDNPLWDTLSTKMANMKSFLSYDRKKMKDITLEVLC